jgi:hypothetical protein
MDRSVADGRGFDEGPGRWRSVVRGLGLADDRVSERSDAGGRSRLEDLLAAGVAGAQDAAEANEVPAR